MTLSVLHTLLKQVVLILCSQLSSATRHRALQFETHKRFTSTGQEFVVSAHKMICVYRNHLSVSFFSLLQTKFNLVPAKVEYAAYYVLKCDGYEC